MTLAALQGVKGNVGVDFNAMALKGKKVSVEIAADREAVCAPFPASLCPRFLRRLAPFGPSAVSRTRDGASSVDVRCAWPECVFCPSGFALAVVPVNWGYKFLVGEQPRICLFELRTAAEFGV